MKLMQIMEARLTTTNFKKEVGSMQLELQINEKMSCSCINVNDTNELALTISRLRRMAYNKVDAAIDIATADFLKSKLKNID